MTQRFIDGTTVPLGYEATVTKVLNDCCDAEEMFDLDELERHASKIRKAEAEADARRDLEESRRDQGKVGP